MREEILRVDQVTRKENGIISLDNIHFHIFKGEIFGMIFITSQGKKELVRLICENITIDYGRVYFNNQMVNNYEQKWLKEPNRVYLIGQCSRLIDTLTVADNIFVIRRGLKKYFINKKLLRNQFYFWFGEYADQIDPDSMASDLKRLERCMVELFRAVVAGCRLIIIQELSSILAKDDLERFYQLMEAVKKDGISFLYIGNHHEEVFSICDRVALAREGKVIRVLHEDELLDRNIKPYIISYGVREEADRRMETDIRGVLDFWHIKASKIKDLTFSVNKGECVVFMNKENEVLSDFLSLMTGKQAVKGGIIYYRGSVYSKNIAQRWLREKIAIIPDNPIENMIFQGFDYLENLSFLIDRKMKRTHINKKVRESIVNEYKVYVGDNIYAKDVSMLDVCSLYSLIYYRIHLYHPNIVICIQPFTGLDMYARRHVVGLLNELRKKGITVIIWTVNISDCLSAADRLFVLEAGKIIKRYEKGDFYHFKEIT